MIQNPAKRYPITNIYELGFPLPKRSLGQNFLVHQGTIETIVKLSGIQPGDRVIELGAGLGAMTGELSKKALKVIGLEIDERLIKWVCEKRPLPGNVELRHSDILRVSFQGLAEEMGGTLKIIGNLPYNISSQVVFKLIEERNYINRATLMFQKEVAERLVSCPGSKAYGILSVVTGYCADVTRLMDIPPGLFRPRPKVTSTLVQMEFREPVIVATDFAFFKNIVRQAFQKRRKKLINALKGLASFSQDEILHALEVCGIDPGYRAEVLSIENFVTLSNTLAHTISSGNNTQMEITH
ncbi:MAG: 16S rRNA (adenine(1518)-N(6)/adenine(1519)-N(6))-dimethyltransferase RsmA [Deltaproteobacteria bacterium]|nr:16S rRNA (adenine(1518)-N(6)/adenine(1519)-N(6))-dimethyltransferase RsmA [Deltaproteobacteria bacterium]